MSYQFLKIIHILSATLMIGTGLGSAFYLYFSFKKNSFTTIKEVLKLVNLADLIFTTPSVIIQLITGLILSDILNYTYSIWFYLVLSVSFGVLVLWLYAVYIQYQLMYSLENASQLPFSFFKRMKIWYYLGIVSFVFSIFLYYLMIYKPYL